MSSDSLVGGLLPVLLEELHSFRRDQGGQSDGAQSLWANVVSELGGESFEALSLRASAGFGGTSAYDARVDSTSDAVLLLDVDLGEVEVLSVRVREVVFHVSPR